MLSEICFRSLWLETSHHHWYWSSPAAADWLTDCLIDWLTDWLTGSWWRVTCVCRRSTPTSSCREFPRTCSTARPVRPSRAGCRYSLRRWRRHTDVTRRRPWLCSSCRTSMSSQSDVLLFFLSVVLSSVMEMCDKFTAVDENATKNITAIQLDSGIAISRTMTLLEGTLEIIVAAFKIKLLST